MSEEVEFRKRLEDEEAETFLNKLGRTLGFGYPIRNLLRGRPVAALKNIVDIATGIATLDPITGMGSRLASREEMPEFTHTLKDMGLPLPRGRGLRTGLDIVGGLATDPLSWAWLGGSSTLKPTAQAIAGAMKGGGRAGNWAGDLATAMATTGAGQKRWADALKRAGGELAAVKKVHGMRPAWPLAARLKTAGRYGESLERRAAQIIMREAPKLDDVGFAARHGLSVEDAAKIIPQRTRRYMDTLKSLEKQGDILAPGLYLDPWMVRVPRRLLGKLPGIPAMKTGALERKLLWRAGGAFDDVYAVGAGATLGTGPAARIISKYTLPGRLWAGLGKAAPDVQKALTAIPREAIRAVWNPLFGRLGKMVPRGVRDRFMDMDRKMREGQFADQENFRNWITNAFKGLDEDAVEMLGERLKVRLGGSMDSIIDDALAKVRADLGLAPRIPTSGRVEYGYRAPIGPYERPDDEVLGDITELAGVGPGNLRMERATAKVGENYVEEFNLYSTPEAQVRRAPGALREGQAPRMQYTHDLAGPDSGKIWFRTRKEAARDWARAKRLEEVVGKDVAVKRTFTANRSSFIRDIQAAEAAGAIDSNGARLLTSISHLWDDSTFDLVQAMAKGDVKAAKKFAVLLLGPESAKATEGVKGLRGVKDELEKLARYVGTEHPGARGGYMYSGPLNGVVMLFNRLDDVAVKAMRRGRRFPLRPGESVGEFQTLARDFMHEMFHNGYYTMLSLNERKRVAKLFYKYRDEVGKAQAIRGEMPTPFVDAPGMKPGMGLAAERMEGALQNPSEFFAEMGAVYGAEGMDSFFRSEIGLSRQDKSYLTKLFMKVYTKISRSLSYMMNFKGSSAMGVNSKFKEEMRRKALTLQKQEGVFDETPWEAMEDLLGRIAPGLDDLRAGRGFSLPEKIGKVELPPTPRAGMKWSPLVGARRALGGRPAETPPADLVGEGMSLPPWKRALIEEAKPRPLAEMTGEARKAVGAFFSGIADLKETPAIKKAREFVLREMDPDIEWKRDRSGQGRGLPRNMAEAYYARTGQPIVGVDSAKAAMKYRSRRVGHKVIEIERGDADARIFEFNPLDLFRRISKEKITTRVAPDAPEPPKTMGQRLVQEQVQAPPSKRDLPIESKVVERRKLIEKFSAYRKELQAAARAALGDEITVYRTLSPTQASGNKPVFGLSVTLDPREAQRAQEAALGKAFWGKADVGKSGRRIKKRPGPNTTLGRKQTTYDEVLREDAISTRYGLRGIYAFKIKPEDIVVAGDPKKSELIIALPGLKVEDFPGLWKARHEVLPEVLFWREQALGEEILREVKMAAEGPRRVEGDLLDDLGLDLSLPTEKLREQIEQKMKGARVRLDILRQQRKRDAAEGPLGIDPDQTKPYMDLVGERIPQVEGLTPEEMRSVTIDTRTAGRRRLVEKTKQEAYLVGEAPVPVIRHGMIKVKHQTGQPEIILKMMHTGFDPMVNRPTGSFGGGFYFHYGLRPGDWADWSASPVRATGGPGLGPATPGNVLWDSPYGPADFHGQIKRASEIPSSALDDLKIEGRYVDIEDLREHVANSGFYTAPISGEMLRGKTITFLGKDGVPLDEKVVRRGQPVVFLSTRGKSLDRLETIDLTKALLSGTKKTGDFDFPEMLDFNARAQESHLDAWEAATKGSRHTTEPNTYRGQRYLTEEDAKDLLMSLSKPDLFHHTALDHLFEKIAFEVPTLGQALPDAPITGIAEKIAKGINRLLEGEGHATMARGESVEGALLKYPRTVRDLARDLAIGGTPRGDTREGFVKKIDDIIRGAGFGRMVKPETVDLELEGVFYDSTQINNFTMRELIARLAARTDDKLPLPVKSWMERSGTPRGATIDLLRRYQADLLKSEAEEIPTTMMKIIEMAEDHDRFLSIFVHPPMQAELNVLRDALSKKKDAAAAGRVSEMYDWAKGQLAEFVRKFGVNYESPSNKRIIDKLHEMERVSDQLWDNAIVWGVDEGYVLPPTVREVEVPVSAAARSFVKKLDEYLEIADNASDFYHKRVEFYGPDGYSVKHGYMQSARNWALDVDKVVALEGLGPMPGLDDVAGGYLPAEDAARVLDRLGKAIEGAKSYADQHNLNIGSNTPADQAAWIDQHKFPVRSYQPGNVQRKDILGGLTPGPSVHGGGAQDLRPRMWDEGEFVPVNDLVSYVKDGRFGAQRAAEKAASPTYAHREMTKPELRAWLESGGQKIAPQPEDPLTEAARRIKGRVLGARQAWREAAGVPTGEMKTDVVQIFDPRDLGARPLRGPAAVEAWLKRRAEGPRGPGFPAPSLPLPTGDGREVATWTTKAIKKSLNHRDGLLPAYLKSIGYHGQLARNEGVVWSPQAIREMWIDGKLVWKSTEPAPGRKIVAKRPKRLLGKYPGHEVTVPGMRKGEVVVYRGVSHGGDALVPRKGYQLSFSTRKAVAESYIEDLSKGAEEFLIDIDAAHVIDVPVRVDKHGNRTFSFTQFDETVRRNPGAVVRAKEIQDIGPWASRERDPGLMFSRSGDIYATRNPALIRRPPTQSGMGEGETFLGIAPIGGRPGLATRTVSAKKPRGVPTKEARKRKGLFLSNRLLAAADPRGEGDRMRGYANVVRQIRSNVNETLVRRDFPDIADSIVRDLAEAKNWNPDQQAWVKGRLQKIQEFLHTHHQHMLQEAQDDLRLLPTVKDADEGIEVGRIGWNFYLPNQISDEWASIIASSRGLDTSRAQVLFSNMETAYERFRSTPPSEDSANKFREAIRRSAKEAGVNVDVIKSDPMQADLLSSVLQRFQAHNRVKWNKRFLEDAARMGGAMTDEQLNLARTADELDKIQVARQKLEDALGLGDDVADKEARIRSARSLVESLEGYRAGDLKAIRRIEDVDWSALEGGEAFVRHAMKAMGRRSDAGKKWDLLNWWIKQSMTVGTLGVPFVAFSLRNLFGGIVQALMDPSTHAEDAFRPLWALMMDFPLTRWMGPLVPMSRKVQYVRDFRKALQTAELRYLVPGETFDQVFLRLIEAGDEGALALQRLEKANAVIGGLRPSEMLREISEHGIVGKDYAATELFKQQMLQDPGSFAAVRRSLSGSPEMTDPPAGIGRYLWLNIKNNTVPRKLASSVEDTLRLNSYLSMREKGISAFNAAERVNRIHIDYKYVSEFDRNLRAIFPFIRFRAGTAPVVLEQAVSRPATVLPLIRGMESMRGQEGELTPPWLGDRMALPLGVNADGDMMFLTSFGVIHEDVNVLMSGVGDIKATLTGKGITFGDWVRVSGLSSLHPLLKGIFQYAVGKDFWFGTDLGDYRRAPAWMTEIPGMEATLSETGLLTKETSKAGKVYHKVPRWYHPVMGMTPLNRLSNEFHRILDQRKPWFVRLLASQTGINVVTVNQERELRRAMAEWLTAQVKAGDIGKLEVFFAKGELPPEAAEMLKYHHELNRRNRRKTEAVEQGPPVGAIPSTPVSHTSSAAPATPMGLGSRLLRPTSLSGL